MTTIDLRGQSQPGTNSPVGTSPFNNSPIGSSMSSGGSPTQTPPNAGGMAGDVIDFVRQQLDTAYRNGQISRDDYDRAVDKLKKR
jgi:hypothetical protein